MTWTFLADAPDVAGLTFRPFAGESDFAEMAAVLNASCAADGIDRIETPEAIAKTYARLDNCDRAADMVVAEIDGRVIGYGRVTWWQEHEGARRYLPLCFIRPEHRNRGIGTAMLRHNEARLQQIAADHPRGPEDTFEAFSVDSDPGALALYEAFGYEPVFHEADLVRPHLEDILEAPMPDGLVVRTPSEEELRKVWEADQEAFRDHIGAAPGTENDYLRFLEFEWFDPTLWRVAWDGDEVAGQVRSFINARENERFGRKRGWTEFISVRRPYRRQGLARSLLVQSLHALKERGMEEAALGVLTENLHGAFRLYESVGFRVVRRTIYLWKSVA